MAKALQRLQEDSGYSKKAAEVLDWTYYDTLKLNSTRNTYRFFVNPLGAGTPPKQLSDTNMVNAGLLPQGQNMKVHAVKFMLFVMPGGDALLNQVFYEVMRDGTLEFVVPGKDSLLTITLGELMGIQWAQIMRPGIAADNYDILSRGQFKGVFPLNIPIKIGAVQSFECRMILHSGWSATNGEADAWIRIGLNGRLIRMS